MPRSKKPAHGPEETVLIDTGMCRVVIDVHGRGLASIASSTLTTRDPDAGWDDDDEPNPQFDGAMHALESFILALVCAGVDVETPEFAKALNTTLESISNECG